MGLCVGRGRRQREGHVGKEFFVSNRDWSRRGGSGRAWSIAQCRRGCRPVGGGNRWGWNTASYRRRRGPVYGGNGSHFGLHRRRHQRCLGGCRWAVRSRHLGWQDLRFLLRRSAGGSTGWGRGHSRSGQILDVLGFWRYLWAGNCRHLRGRATKPHIRERGDRLGGLLRGKRRSRQARKRLLRRLQLDGHGCRGSNRLRVWWGRLAASSQLPEISLKDCFGQELLEFSAGLVNHLHLPADVPGRILARLGAR